MTGGRALIPKNAFGWPILAGLFFARVGSFCPFFNFHALGLGEQMRPDDADEFAGADDFGFLPELWEVALIAGNQVVRAGGVGAFEENVIGGVGRDLKRAGGR